MSIDYSQYQWMKLLPINGEAFYYADFLDATEAATLFDELVSGIDVTNRLVKMGDGSEYIGVLGKLW